MVLHQKVDDPTVVGLSMMRTTKVSVTIDSDLLEEVRSYAGGNLSRYVNAALREQVRSERLRTLVAEYEAEFGPIPAEALAEARAEFEAAEAAWAAWQDG
jgi:post-segregation antitoxin (ccd killing protein)